MSELVFYSPEFDKIFTRNRGDAYLFSNEIGDFYLMYFLEEYKFKGKVYEPFYTFEAYIVGEL